jgi:hypothetical protein
MYDAVADDDCYPGMTVLKNKLDVRDAEELDALRLRSAMPGPTRQFRLAISTLSISRRSTAISFKMSMIGRESHARFAFQKARARSATPRISRERRSGLSRDSRTITSCRTFRRRSLPGNRQSFSQPST